MVTKKDLISSELLKEIIRIRLDALGKMLELQKKGQLPGILEEGATGEFDNKGAIFVPGGLVFEDSDRHPIRKEAYTQRTPRAFRQVIRECMQKDNATLLFQDGYLDGVNLDNGFFAAKSTQILAIKRAAGRRPRTMERRPPSRIYSAHICKSLSPESMPAPYGSRTKLSSCLAVCLIEPRLYYLQCTSEYALRGVGARRAWERIRAARRSVRSSTGTVLAPPYIVVCHQTRYREQILGGVTRILGIGEFGEFATFTLETVTAELAEELREKGVAWSQTEVFALADDKPVLGVIRIYPPTSPGARSRGSHLMLISPPKDLDFNIDHFMRRARRRYRLD